VIVSVCRVNSNTLSLRTEIATVLCSRCAGARRPPRPRLMRCFQHSVTQRYVTQRNKSFYATKTLRNRRRRSGACGTPQANGNASHFYRRRTRPIRDAITFNHWLQHCGTFRCVKLKIHYNIFPVASRQQVQNINDKLEPW